MKAIVLVSGGLDSALAAKIITKQNVDVVGINFLIPFRPIEKISSNFNLKKFFDNLGIEIKSVDIFAESLKMIENPKFGFGSNLNPCLDCHILMLKKAKELLGKNKASFVVTGEVLGQRPMSQHRQALKLVEKESGLEGLVLRPLSANLLDLTIPEEKGWVKRDELFDFSGRSRKPQIKLAQKLGIKDYLTPAGGCLLTDPGFCRRLKDLQENSKDMTFNLNDIELLKLGRHFRIGANDKLIVGRNEEENNKLLKLAKDRDYVFEPQDVTGPIAIGRGKFNSSDLFGLASQIVARYCDVKSGEAVKLNLSQKDSSGQFRQIISSAINNNFLENLRIN
ncbi:MAG: tRNA 4-thiouridine(8) synthase ThiI [Candidatus Omnitrophica bacterium]|nr:tRNA 4-thiouridine(8) synthase ThiI [Candidatus Omnitrophota bacterium]